MLKQNIIAENTRKHEDVDMKKYRYQRNIKQLDRWIVFPTKFCYSNILCSIYIKWYHFFFSNSDSHFNITSNLFWLFAETLKQATVRSFKDDSSILSITSCSFSEPAKSFLFPNTRRGIPAKLLFSSNSCIWALAKSIFATIRSWATLVVGINNKDNDIWISAKFFPWLSEPSLSSQIPQLHRYFALVRKEVPFLI